MEFALEGERQPLVGKQETGGFVPDLVIVFPRPKPAEPGCCSSGPLKFTKEQVEKIFDNTLVRNNDVAQTKSEADADNEGLEAPYEASVRLGQTVQQDGFVEMKDIQDAVIIDFVNYLTLENCHTLAFKSCDDDDLFLCVSIGDPSKTAQKDVVVTKAAEEAMIKVQTSLDGDRADEKLGIKQTLKRGEELYIQFDMKVIESLNSIFNFPNFDQAGRDGRKNAVVKQYPIGIARTEGSIFRCVDRTRLLMTKIESFVDLEDLLGMGVITDYYMPHNVVKLEEFRSGKASTADAPLYHTPHDAWANFRFSTILNALRWDYEDVQPIHDIRNYFGERVAFYFVWLSFTGRFIATLVPFGFVLAILYQFAVENDDLKACLTLFSATMICIMSALYAKLWRRCENYYAAVWGMSSGDVDTNHRPDYRGDDVPDPLNQNNDTRMYPWLKGKAVYFLAVLVTVVFIGVVIGVVILIYSLEEKLPKSVVSAIFSLQILIFQLVWEVIAGMLVEFANPRTQDDAKDLAVQFLFPFSFVSTYANIFFHAFYTKWDDMCLHKNCMDAMRPSLYAVVVPALLLQLVSMLKPYALYRYQLNAEMKQVSQESPENPSVDRSFLEAQAKRPPFGIAELNLEMNIMMILFGYLMLFGFVAPGITLAIALTFILKIRIDAFKLCSVYQRTMPSKKGVSGIGEWNDVLSMLLFLGRYTASFIAILNLEYFNLDREESWVLSLMPEIDDKHTRRKVFQKMVLAFAFKELMDRLCELLISGISDVSSETKLMKAKRERVAAKMSAKVSEKSQAEEVSQGSQASARASAAEEAAKSLAMLQGNDDSKVPFLDNNHPVWTDEMDMDYVPPSEGGSGGGGGLLPDLIIGFPRPQADAQPGCCVAGNTKYNKADVDAIFDEALVLRDKRASVQGEESVALYKRCLKIEEKEETTLLEIQTALISDMIEFLSKNNCHTMLFRSCDGDELFLCVGLGNPKITAQQDHSVMIAAQQASIKVQTTLNKELGDEKLKVLQDVDRWEEMFMTFHLGVLTNLSKALGFTPPTEAVSGDVTLIKQYTAGIAGTEGSMLRTVDRVRLLMGKIEEFVDLEDALGDGILSDYYCPHHSIKLQEFSSGKAPVEGSPSYQEPHDPWSTFDLKTLFCAPLSWKFTDVQPIQEIRNYYGERIAFYFAWLAFTARAAFVAIPVCIGFSIAYLTVHVKKQDEEHAEELKIEALVHILCSVLACVGATLYHRFWKRWETYYAALWGMTNMDASEVRRPDYRGDPQPDPLNENKMVKTYPRWKAIAVYIMVLTITVIFIGIVICTVTLIYWLDTILPYDTKQNKSVISALFSIQIVIFQLLWDFISQKLVVLANPRTDDEAKDLAVQFLFPFSFVSTYSNIAYHSFFTGWKEGSCVSENCMTLMRPVLYQVVLPALVMQVISMLKPYAMYRWQLHDELKQLRIKNNLEEDAKIYRSLLEAQAKRPPFGTAEFNLEMNTMLILVGYGVLFGFVAPGISVAVALAFMLKIRIDAFKLCSVYQRVFPARAAVTGIGEWNVVLTGLTTIGRFTACAIPIFNLKYLNLPAKQSELVRLLSGETATEMSAYGKIACVFILKELIDIICALVTFGIADESPNTKLMKAKRTKMATRLTAKVSKFNRDNRKAEVDSAFQEKLNENFKELKKKLDERTGSAMADIPKLDSNNKEYWSLGMDTDFAPAFEPSTYFGK